jgi:two-component system sensor histidine kinase KdpD
MKEETMIKTLYKSMNKANRKTLKTHIKCLLWVVMICGLTTSLSVLLNSMGIGKENTLMIFLIGVLAITVLTKGYFYGFIGSIVSLLLFNYFFTEPLHSFIISNAQDYILIAFFLLASLICGTMSSKFQRQTEIAKQNEKTARQFYDISESFLNLSSTSSIVKKGINYINKYSNYPCSVKLDHTKFDAEESYYCSDNFSLPDYDKSKLYILPIKGLASQIGTITLANVDQPLSYEKEMLIKTVVYQMALVLDREFIYNERERIKLAMESEHLKSTLLRSVSHDIRTPLTGILGASSLILDSYEGLDDSTIRKLITDINEESSWLINSVQNILDMTRISEGHLMVNKEFESVDDLINQTVTHIPWLTNSNRLRVVMSDDIILVETDGRLIVQVLVNLLDNAVKHSGPNSIVELKAYREDNNVVFEVSDNGFGIAESIKSTLFESFITHPRYIADSSRGVGLGLAICKAIVEAHGGTITASDNPGGGAIFRIVLPSGEELQ